MATVAGRAAITHFLIFPETSRDAVRELMGEYITTLQDTLKVHAAYFESMERIDMFVRTQTRNPTEEKRLYRAKADAAKEAARKVSRMHASLSNELPFAKREIAYGKFGSGEFGEIFKRLRGAMLPIMGLSTVVDVFDRVMEWNNWVKDVEEGGVDPKSDVVHARMVADWNLIMAQGHDRFARIWEVMDEGLQHVAYQLDVRQRRRRGSVQKDVESVQSTRPGEEGFSQYLEAKCEEFYKARLVTLREWCEDKGIELPEDYFYHPADAPIKLPENVPGELPRDRNERQLNILLYVCHPPYLV